MSDATIKLLTNKTRPIELDKPHTTPHKQN